MITAEQHASLVTKIAGITNQADEFARDLRITTDRQDRTTTEIANLQHGLRNMRLAVRLLADEIDTIPVCRNPPAPAPVPEGDNHG